MFSGAEVIFATEFMKKIAALPCKKTPISVDLNDSKPQQRMWQLMQGSLLMVVIRVLVASEYTHCYEREREGESAVGN